jgi:hypothetical protein
LILVGETREWAMTKIQEDDFDIDEMMMGGRETRQRREDGF